MNLSSYILSLDIDQTVIFSDFTVLSSGGDSGNGGGGGDSGGEPPIFKYIFDGHTVNKFIYQDNKPYIDLHDYYNKKGQYLDLKIGETCFIEYDITSNTLQVPLRMNLNSVYEMFTFTYNTRGSNLCSLSSTDPGCFLYPNGQSYTNKFYMTNIYRGSSGSWNGEITSSGFRFSILLNEGKFLVYNFKTNKRIISLTSFFGNSSNSTAGIDSIIGIASVQNDPEEWHQFGNIVFPCNNFNYKGVILIKRII